MSALRKATIKSALRPLKSRDRRKHKRVDMYFDGRFMQTGGGEDHVLRASNVSCGGALVKSEFRPDVGSRIVCYLDELGRFDGVVSRATGDGFAVNFRMTPHRRDKVADKLTWVLNKDRLGLREERGAVRHADGRSAVITREDGRKVQCKVIDISLTGAGFEADGAAPLVGEIIRAGKLKGEVVRRQGRSFGVRFVHPISVSGNSQPEL